MNKPKILFSIAAFLFVCLFSLPNSFAQIESQPKLAPANYEIVLQTITASNNAGDKTALPSSLANVVRKLKNTYSFSSYHLDSTYLQRTSGSVELRSVANILNQNQENFVPVFSDWSLTGLKSFPDAQGKNTIQFQSFRYGQRVPVKASAGVVNYEQVGIKLDSFGVTENVPTVVSCLSTTKSDELIFLVLTVRAAE